MGVVCDRFAVDTVFDPIHRAPGLYTMPVGPFLLSGPFRCVHVLRPNHRRSRGERGVQLVPGALKMLLVGLAAVSIHLHNPSDLSVPSRGVMQRSFEQVPNVAARHGTLCA